MAVNDPLGSPQEHIEMCESHKLPIDMICEDCDEFICAKCAKTDHREHDWNTLPTAASLRKRGLLKFLEKIKEEDLPGIDEKIEKMSNQITNNTELCDSGIKKVHKHFDEITTRLRENEKHYEKTLRDNLVKKNDQFNHVKSELDKKKREIVNMAELVKNNSPTSYYSLIDNHRKLKKMLSELKVCTTDCEYSVRFAKGEINDDLLESLVGRTLDLDDIGVTQINSFQYGDHVTAVLETFSENKCYIKAQNLEYTEEVNKEGAKNHKFSITPNDMCVAGNGDVYFTDDSNNSISCLSPSGSVSTVISTDPLGPIGICLSVDGGLLVTLRDKESHDYELDLDVSRRLVRHITGDVIHDIEYQEDGQTRLFTLPYRVTQNRNSDICVANLTSDDTGELLILSPSGCMKLVYRGQKLTENFCPADVVCDSFCNILVTDPFNNCIHLLSSDREFLKFLLTENEVDHPYTLSLYKSTLWVGYYEGLVKVFQYKK